MINWKILWFSLSTGLQFSILSVSQPVGNQHSGHIWHGNMKCAKYIIMDLATTEQDLIFSNKQWHHTQKQEMTSMVFYYKPEDTSAFLHIYLHFLYYTQWMHALRKYINFVILEPNVIHTYTCYRNEGGGGSQSSYQKTAHFNISLDQVKTILILFWPFYPILGCPTI